MKKFNLNEDGRKAIFYYLMRWDFGDESRYALHSAISGRAVAFLTLDEAQRIFDKGLLFDRKMLKVRGESNASYISAYRPELSSWTY